MVPLNVEQPQSNKQGRASARRRDRLWVTSTYFAEGYPYTIINNLAEILFQQLGASLRVVGLTSLFHLPWNLKFLWGPLVDRYETKRRWLLGTEIILCVGMLLLALATVSGQWLGLLSLLFMLLAFVSATHDIAIDGYYLEALDDEGQSRFVGYRAMAYKAASLLVRGPMLIVIGAVGWTLGLLALTGIMFLVLLLHLFVLPRVEQPQAPLRRWLVGLRRTRWLVAGMTVAGLALVEQQTAAVSAAWSGMRATLDATPLGRISVGGWIAFGLLAGLLVLMVLKRRVMRSTSEYARAFVDFLDQPRVGIILVFVVFFRSGESFLQKMKWPFLNDVMNMAIADYGFVNGTLGVIASFVATLAGGALIAKHGLRRWIWPFVLAQNVLNVLYVWLASQSSPPPLSVLTAVICFEHFGEGLGTAVFMVYLMRCCDPRHKAAHMAIVTALMSVSFTIAGVVSGFIAERVGFVNYFLFTCFATLPGMAVLFFLPHLDGRQQGTSGAA